MKDIQVPGGTNNSRGPVSASGGRPIIPVEQAKRFVAPANPVKREYFQPKKASSSKKFLALGLFLSLIIISAIFFLATFAFDGATITIKPETRKDNGLNESYIISELDRKDLLLTKSLGVNETITVAKKSTKKVFKKAEGEVTIYNAFSKDVQKLLKGTRLSTTDGKIFKTSDAVTVPGKNGTTPGQIKVRVQADADGVEYNIGPTKFTLPGLKASPKYKDFYAESSVTMRGGASGSSAEVSDADYQKALSDLKTKLTEDVQNQIGSDAPEGFIFDKDTLLLQTSRVERVSEDDSTATYSQSATGTTLFFKRDEIVKRILQKQYANETSKPTVKLLDTSKLVMSVSNQTEAMTNNSQVTISVTGPAPAVYYPDKQIILEYYAGRSVSEFNDIAKKFQFVESAKRTIYPFWNTKFPSNISKIKIEFEE